MTITKAQLIDSISNQLNLPRNRSAQLLESLLEIIKKKLENGEDILISGFGKFCVKDKSRRRGRTSATDENLMLELRRVVILKYSPVLKEKINAKK